MMLAIALVVGSFMFLTLLLLGGIIGYLAYGYLAVQASQLPQHPEFYDAEGNIIADEILAIRFEGSLDDDWEDEE